MVDDATHFNAAQFIDPLTTDSVWEPILTLCEAVYTGLPNPSVFDSNSQLRDTFVEICEIHDLEYQKSGKNTRVHKVLKRDIMNL